MIIINPNIEHTEKSDTDYPLEYIALGIQGLSFSSLENPSPVTIHNYSQDQKTFFYLQQLVEEVENHQEDYDLIIQNILEILLLKMMRKNLLM